MKETASVDLTKKRMRDGYLCFDEARKYARSLHLKKRTEWRTLCKSENPDNNLPGYIPKHPDAFYKSHGWISWRNWLGKDGIPEKHDEQKTH